MTNPTTATPSRRTVMRGAAWAVPAVAAATALPAFAASTLKPAIFCPATGFFVDQQDSDSTTGSDYSSEQWDKSLWKFNGPSKDTCYWMHIELIPVNSAGTSITGTAEARKFDRIEGSNVLPKGIKRGIHLISKNSDGPLKGSGKSLPLTLDSRTGVISAEATFSIGPADTTWGIAFSLKAPKIFGVKTGPLYKSQLQLREIQCTSTGSVAAGPPEYLTAPCSAGTNDTVAMPGQKGDGVF